MKGWLGAGTLLTILVGTTIGLWLTWDSTRVENSVGVGAADAALLFTPTTTPVEMSDDAETAAAPVPACGPGDEAALGDPLEDWATIVLDPTHRLATDFMPPDLVPVSEAGFDNSHDMVRRILIDDLVALRQAAEQAGNPIIVVSAHRSHRYQEELFERKVEEQGAEGARRSTAEAGHSEHHLGTTIDVLDPQHTELTPGFADTPAGRWVAEHAPEYGFVLSYPADAFDRACYEFEPWHLRYVGRDLAREIVESGLTPREWMLANGPAADAG